ncbi:formin-like protein 5 [Orycteropus afer afer]|uniref:Formin-like protein 5 n=1 Tax=Orycteropus afer afer TaxID=1230840 RepID=A0AC54Z8Q8_ORYAF|nr:formin-like protein 5 [Orycteropus afer afer]
MPAQGMEPATRTVGLAIGSREQTLCLTTGHRRELSSSSNPQRVHPCKARQPAEDCFHGSEPRRRTVPGFAALPDAHPTPTCPCGSNSPLRSMLAAGPPLRANPRARSALGPAACSAEPAACLCRLEHFANPFEGGRRPPAGGPRPPPLRPLGPLPPRLLQAGARTHRQAPGKAPGSRLQDREIGGAGAATLSRAAPPPKVFSLRPPPGTILGRRLSKYLPQPQGRSSGYFNAPPQPSRPPGASARNPTPSCSPFAAGGHREKRLRAYAPRTRWVVRTAARSPNYNSAPLSISGPAGAPYSSEARRLFSAPDSSGGPSRPAFRAPRTLFFGGRR